MGDVCGSLPHHRPSGLDGLPGLLRRAVWWLLLLGAVFMLTTPSAMAFATSVPGATVAQWELRSSVSRPMAYADQGVATLTRPDGSTVLVTRGGASVPDELADAGWIHIGDPDSRDGYVVDAYQGNASARAKLFVITSPSGTRSYYRHPLVADERYNNSFAAFTPDRRWLVSGEWGTMRRLLVFATPSPNPSAPVSGSTLRLSSTIMLQRPMRDVQGCAFSSTTTLVCSTNDHGRDLFPVAEQLLAVHLAHPIDGRPDRASVRLLGAVPQDPTCAVLGETEGLDIHGNTLLLAVNSPCRPVTVVSTYAVDRFG